MTDRKGRPINLLLTGPPRVGKTTVLTKVLGQLNLCAGGFFTEEIREGGQRVGFSIADLRGKKGILAHIASKSPFRVGRYGVNVEDILRIGVPALERARAECGLIVCDEIGRMETCCEEFCEALLRCLDSEKPLLGTIQMRAHPFLDLIRARQDVEIIAVTALNRGELPGQLVNRLRGLLRR